MHKKLNRVIKYLLRIILVKNKFIKLNPNVYVSEFTINYTIEIMI